MQAFLSAHYSCDTDTEHAGASEEAKSGWKELGVPEVEVFTLFQRFRADVLQWCERHGDECR